MKTIVVGVDGSASSIQALRWAIEEARLHSADVRVVHAWSRPVSHSMLDTVSPVELGIDFEAEAAETLKRSIAEGTRDATQVKIRSELVHARSAAALIRAAQNADLLVVGSHGLGGFAGLLLGSVSRQCAHHSPSPIAIVRPKHRPEPTGRIVVGVDGSENASRAVDWAAAEAKARGCRVHLVHSWTYPALSMPLSALEDLPPIDVEAAAKEVLTERTRQLVAEGVEVDGEVSNELASQSLIQASSDADLLVVGARGTGGFKGLLLGSVSDQCAHHAHCPVVIVR